MKVKRALPGWIEAKRALLGWMKVINWEFSSANQFFVCVLCLKITGARW